MLYKRESPIRSEILWGGGRFLTALIWASCIYFCEKEVSVKAVLTRTASTYKRHHTDISGSKSHSGIPSKKVKVNDTTGVTLSPLKRSIRQVQGGINGGASPRKRMAYSFPKTGSEDIDKNDPNVWVNHGTNVFGDKEVVSSNSTPELILVTSYNDFTYKGTDKSGKTKIISTSEDGSGWVQGRDIIWTDD